MNKDVLAASRKALKRVNVSAKRHEDDWDFVNWLTSHVQVKHGKYQGLYRFDGHEPYMEIARQLHLYKENWFLKGTQIGFSTLMIGWNLYLPYWKGLDSGYALPDKVMIKPFMKTRFSEEQIQHSGELAGIYEMHESDMYYGAGRNYLYFLGANVLSEGMSRPIEQMSLDEVTIISKANIELMEDRLGHASFGQINGFAMEIYPGGPADEGFNRGRQNMMLFDCPRCGSKDQNLEEIFYESSMNKEPFPRCVKLTDGHWQVVCVKCGKPYSRKDCGRWVAKFADRDVNSWRIPQLIMEGLDLDRFMRRWKKSAGKKSVRSHLHATGLAIPDAGDLQGVQKEHLKLLKQDYKMTQSASWSVGGGDLGNTCWVVFAEMRNQLRYLWWQPVDSDNMVEVISKLIISLNCRKFVIDYKPFTPQVRELQKRFPGIVIAHEYRESGLEEKEKDHEGQSYDFVQEDREEALDSYDDLITQEPPVVIMPARVYEPEFGEVDLEDSTFAKHHYKGSQKDEMEDARLGKKIFKHKKHVENHFYHAGNYMYTALRLMSVQAGKFVGAPVLFGNLHSN